VTLAPDIRERLSLPAICPPMFLVSGPDLVREACLSGVIGGFPRANARTREQFDAWLSEIVPVLDGARAEGRRVAPIAANFATKLPPEEIVADLRLIERHGIDIVITANGDPTEVTRIVHDWGGRVFHDVTTVRFAEKAIAAGVDGLTCIGAGGGGHSGTVSHLALIPKVRAMFDGTIVAAGAITTGAAVRAAEILGADLSYLGTRYIATKESMASEEYKQMLVDGRAADLHYLPARGGVPANWLGPSLARAGVDVETLRESYARHERPALPPELKYWAEVWSAGQGIELIDDIPTVAELTLRLRREYVEACAVPDMRAAAQLVDEALDAH
jgi:nitronate monooxygenase